MNDSMGQYVSAEIVKLMVQEDIKIKGANILILGVTFKENCPDVRNTRVVDVVKNLKSYGTNITVFDPWAKPEEVMHEYNIETVQVKPEGQYDAVVLAVSHNEFLKINLRDYLRPSGILYDVKGVLKEKVDGRL